MGTSLKNSENRPNSIGVLGSCLFMREQSRLPICPCSFICLWDCNFKIESKLKSRGQTELKIASEEKKGSERVVKYGGCRHVLRERKIKQKERLWHQIGKTWLKKACGGDKESEKNEGFAPPEEVQRRKWRPGTFSECPDGCKRKRKKGPGCLARKCRVSQQVKNLDKGSKLL